MWPVRSWLATIVYCNSRRLFAKVHKLQLLHVFLACTPVKLHQFRNLNLSTLLREIAGAKTGCKKMKARVPNTSIKTRDAISYLESWGPFRTIRSRVLCTNVSVVNLSYKVEKHTLCRGATQTRICFYIRQP